VGDKEPTREELMEAWRYYQKYKAYQRRYRSRPQVQARLKQQAKLRRQQDKEMSSKLAALFREAAHEEGIDIEEEDER
jgi:hypothetical protein